MASPLEMSICRWGYSGWVHQQFFIIPNRSDPQAHDPFHGAQPEEKSLVGYTIEI
ncbi:MAG: hypothetical protein CM1200mP14_23010 [Gammaproteobacteria bacterium]|nr:MAG: hypothetical protein CM1200mP14_23010 [Gammaproteobacteria bacterium]